MGSREVEICHKCGDWDYPWGGCSCDEPSREGERLSVRLRAWLWRLRQRCGAYPPPANTGRSPVSPSTCVSLSRLRSLIPEIPSSDDGYRMLSRNALRDIHLCLAEAEAVAQDQQRQAQQLPGCDHSNFWRLHANWIIRSCPDCGSSSPDDGQTWRPPPDDADMPQRRSKRLRWLAERNSAVDADGRQCKTRVA